MQIPLFINKAIGNANIIMRLRRMLIHGTLSKLRFRRSREGLTEKRVRRVDKGSMRRTHKSRS